MVGVTGPKPRAMRNTPMTETKDSEETPLTVYYDGACPLCSLEIAHYRRQAGSENLRFVDASDPSCALGDDLARDRALKRFHVRDSSGDLISGAAGFARIWAVLPRWRWAARLAALPGITPLLELLYRGFLPVRPALSRLAGRLQRR